MKRWTPPTQQQPTNTGKFYTTHIKPTRYTANGIEATDSDTENPRRAKIAPVVRKPKGERRKQG